VVGTMISRMAGTPVFSDRTEFSESTFQAAIRLRSVCVRFVDLPRFAT
jgi:hypothetical protein